MGLQQVSLLTDFLLFGVANERVDQLIAACDGELIFLSDQALLDNHILLRLLCQVTHIRLADLSHKALFLLLVSTYTQLGLAGSLKESTGGPLRRRLTCCLILCWLFSLFLCRGRLVFSSILISLVRIR